jgi:hypothetical protein
VALLLIAVVVDHMTADRVIVRIDLGIVSTLAQEHPSDRRLSEASVPLIGTGIPKMAQPSRLDLLREEDGNLAAELRDSLDASARFPTWTVHELADVIPNRDDRVDLVQSLRPRGCDFFTEPLPAFEVWPDAPCGYLRTSAAYEYWTRIAEQRGWSVVHRDGHSLPSPIPKPLWSST